MFLKNEVQRISSTYNEEQQKLELMNKVEVAEEEYMSTLFSDGDIRSR